MFGRTTLRTLVDLVDGLLESLMPLRLEEGEEGERQARRITDRWIARHWRGGPPPTAARDLVTAALLHVHTERRQQGVHTTRLEVLEAFARAATHRDLLRRMRAAELHPFAVAVAIDMVDFDDSILAQVFAEAERCLGSDDGR